MKSSNNIVRQMKGDPSTGLGSGGCGCSLLAERCWGWGLVGSVHHDLHRYPGLGPTLIYWCRHSVSMKLCPPRIKCCKKHKLCLLVSLSAFMLLALGCVGITLPVLYWTDGKVFEKTCRCIVSAVAYDWPCGDTCTDGSEPSEYKNSDQTALEVFIFAGCIPILVVGVCFCCLMKFKSIIMREFNEAKYDSDHEASDDDAPKPAKEETGVHSQSEVAINTRESGMFALTLPQCISNHCM